jgi:hypothetical protein
MWWAAGHNTHQLIDGQFARPTASHDGAELIERSKVSRLASTRWCASAAPSGKQRRPDG